MKKVLLAGLFALLSYSHANAGYIQDVSGGDLAGIDVTVGFSDGSSDSATWAMSSIDSANGGAFGNTAEWSLTLNGDSFGDFDPSTGSFYGLFDFMNFSGLDVVSITLSILDEGFVFDTAFGDSSLNGSGPGREFASSDFSGGTTATYANLVEDELYGTMIISTQVAAGQGSLQFMTDIDAIDVPAPAGLVLMGLALAGLRLSQRKR